MFKAAGLLGGHHPVSSSIALLNAELLPTLDSGRAAVGLYLKRVPGVAIRQKLDTILLFMLRHILGVSSRASSEGVIGECGVLTDISRDDLKHLLLFHAFCAAPQHSLPSQLLSAMLTDLKACPAPFFSRAAQLLKKYSLVGSKPADPAWKRLLKSRVKQSNQADWRERLSNVPELRHSFPRGSPLRLQPYLIIPVFAGRQLLTKMRLNDLPLNHSPRYGKIGGK